MDDLEDPDDLDDLEDLDSLEEWTVAVPCATWSTDSSSAGVATAGTCNGYDNEHCM